MTVFEVWCPCCEDYQHVYDGTNLCPDCNAPLDYGDAGPYDGDPDRVHDFDR